MYERYRDYMNNGKKPGCGGFLLVLVIFFVFPLVIIYKTNHHVTKDNFYTTGRIKSHAGINIRSEANSKAVILGTVPYNEKVIIIEKNGGNETISGQAGNWIRIEYNGMTGWVWSGFIEL
jgi:hypothetical protein